MKRLHKVVFAALCLIAFLATVGHAFAQKQLTDQQIQKILIEQSLASYPGHCPCPYNVYRAGRSCGRRSAYSRPGGYSPLCYPSDITPQMIKAYRKDHGPKEAR